MAWINLPLAATYTNPLFSLPMGAVIAQILHDEVLVPEVDSPVSRRMGRMLLPATTGNATRDDGCLLEQIGIILDDFTFSLAEYKEKGAVCQEKPIEKPAVRHHTDACLPFFTVVLEEWISSPSIDSDHLSRNGH
jgi:hypothetical protein